jgi:hypothetical protein
MADALTNLTNGINWGGMGKIGFFMVCLTAGLIIVFLIVWLVWDYMRHNYKILVLEKMGSTFNISYDRGRLYYDKKGQCTIFHLYKAGLNYNPPLNQHFGLFKTKKKAIVMYKPKEGEYAPLSIDEGLLKLKVEDHAHDKWHALKIKESYEQYKKQSFWEKYGSIISYGVTIVFCFVMVLVTLNHIKDVSGAIYALAEKMPDKGQILEVVAGAGK